MSCWATNQDICDTHLLSCLSNYRTHSRYLPVLVQYSLQVRDMVQKCETLPCEGHCTVWKILEKAENLAEIKGTSFKRQRRQ